MMMMVVMAMVEMALGLCSPSAATLSQNSVCLYIYFSSGKHYCLALTLALTLPYLHPRTGHTTRCAFQWRDLHYAHTHTLYYCLLTAEGCCCLADGNESETVGSKMHGSEVRLQGMEGLHRHCAIWGLITIANAIV